MSDEDVRPFVGEDGVPRCFADECPSYDGKRCRALGFRPSTICEPAVIEMHAALAAKDAEIAALRTDVERHERDGAYERGFTTALLSAAEEERRALRDRVAAMKLRALAAHEAIWRATNGRPSDAVKALMDDGEVHEAVHAIIAVETESVSAPEEWRAHVERQDRRIEALEAERAELHAEADRWRDAARKLGEETAALRAEVDNERTQKRTAERVIRETRDALLAAGVDGDPTIAQAIEALTGRASRAEAERDALRAECDALSRGFADMTDGCLEEQHERERLTAELSRLRARDERTAQLVRTVGSLRKRYAYARDGEVTVSGLMALWDAYDAIEREDGGAA